MVLECEILCSDEDQIIADYLCVGYNNSFRLVIYIESHHARTNRKRYLAAAFVEKEDAYALAHRLHVPMTGLPDALAKEFDYDIVNASRAQVGDAFQEMIDFLCTHRIPYKISTSPDSLE